MSAPVIAETETQEILRLTRETHANIARIREIVEELAPEIMPTVNTLMAHPMLKMLVGRKKS